MNVAVDTARSASQDRREQASAASAPATLRPWLALVARDLRRFARDRTRWLGVAAQPLLFWLLIGQGLDGAFRVEGIPDLGYAAFFFPGIVVLAGLFTAIFATMSLIEDRQVGLLRLATVSPLPRLGVATARVASVTALGLVQSLAVLAFGSFAGVEWGQVDWLALFALLTVGTASMAVWGVAMAWRLSSVHAYHALMSVVLLPLWILSSAMFPADHGVPGWLLVANPLFYLVDGTRAALGGAAATLDPWWSVLVLAGLAVVGLVVVHRVASALPRAPRARRAPG